MFYYCTCSSRRRHDVARGKTPYRMVEVDKEGICKDCQHYAVACPKAITGTNELYNYLFKREPLRDELAARIEGGLTLKAQRNAKSEEYKKARRKGGKYAK